MLERGNWKAWFTGALSIPVLKFSCARCKQSCTGDYNARQLAAALQNPLSVSVFHCGAADPCPVELLQYLADNQRPEPLPAGPPKGDTNPLTMGGMLRHVAQLTGAERPNSKIPVPLFADELPRASFIDTWTAKRD